MVWTPNRGVFDRRLGRAGIYEDTAIISSQLPRSDRSDGIPMDRIPKGAQFPKRLLVSRPCQPVFESKHPTDERVTLIRLGSK